MGKYAIEDYFSSRQSLLGLLLVPASVLSLQLSRLPIWLIVFSLFVFIWRFQIYRGAWLLPNKILRFFLVAASVTLVVLHYQEWYALDPMVSLLVIAFLLKVLEVTTKRDALVLIFVGYFVTASAFLFNQGILITLVGVIVLWLLTACLFNVHAEVTSFFSRRTMRLVSVLLVQSVPLMLLFLFVLPRVGALWSVPLQSSQAYTGVSDSMSPGDFSNLIRSEKLAFRVSFSDNRPPVPAERYWRGLVLTQFDGREWTRLDQTTNAVDSQSNIVVDDTSEALNYEIVLEATGQPWLYAIPFARIDENVQRTSTNELLLADPVLQRKKYLVSSYVNASNNESSESLRQSLLLPRGFNTRAIAQAQQWRAESDSSETYINRVLSFFNASFTYTLSPPRLGVNSVDEFLFSTQAGFCEHFASSFVVMMRAVGIPARVVVGYQGGEWNAADNYLIVRQQDAHAWAEVWLPNRGWVRVDPTTAVAPNRVELGLSESLSQEEQNLLSTSVLPSFAWINRLALRWDSLNYRWQRWVLQFDEEQQSSLLQDLLGQVTATRLAMLLLLPATLLLLLFSLPLLRYRKPSLSREQKLYKILVKRLKHHGIDAGAGTTITELCHYAAKKLPEKNESLTEISRYLNAYLYEPSRNREQFDYGYLYHLLKEI